MSIAIRSAPTFPDRAELRPDCPSSGPGVCSGKRGVGHVPAPRRAVSDADVRRIARMIRGTYGVKYGGVLDVEDFVQAGMVGLMMAAHEYDEERGAWHKLSEWRARQEARMLLRRMAHDAIPSVNDERKCGEAHERESVDPEPDFVLRDQVIAAWMQLTGEKKRQLARLVWVDGKDVSEAERELGMTYATARSHLSYARDQAARALADGNINPNLRRAGRNHARTFPYSCRFCGYRWISRNAEAPLECPECRRRSWNGGNADERE